MTKKLLKQQLKKFSDWLLKPDNELGNLLVGILVAAYTVAFFVAVKDSVNEDDE